MAERPRPYLRQGIVLYELRSRDSHPQYYSGTHYFNRHDSRTKRTRPKEEWVAQEVPAIIPAKTFRRVQNALYERRPNVTPARVSNSDVLLTGIVRCECCGALSWSARERADATATMPVPRTG